MTITKGSPKQIDWANKLRARHGDRLAAISAKLAGKSGADILLAAAERVLNNPDAVFWIEQAGDKVALNKLLIAAMTDAVVATSPTFPRDRAEQAIAGIVYGA